MYLIGMNIPKRTNSLFSEKKFQPLFQTHYTTITEPCSLTTKKKINTKQ